MSDERRRVLDLLAQGKITVEEADQLLGAVAAEARRSESAGAAEPGGEAKPRFVRINVRKLARDSHVGKDVNIRVPLSILRSGMRLGAIIPALAGDSIKARLRERGVDVDLSKFDPAAIESMLAEMGELNIDVDDGRASVRVTCE